MRSILLATTVLFGIHAPLHADTASGPVSREELRFGPEFPERFAAALKHDAWVAGEMFDGFGVHSITTYYTGDAERFRDFIESLRAVLQPPGQESWPPPVWLTLAPGRGHDRTHDDEMIEYDWSVRVSEHYDDQGLSRPYVTQLTDKEGRPVQRVVPGADRRTLLSPHSIMVTWYV